MEKEKVREEVKNESLITSGDIREYRSPFGWGYKFTTPMNLRITEDNIDKIFEFVINILREQKTANKNNNL